MKLIVHTSAICLFIILCAAPFVLKVHRVVGASMEPTLHKSEVVVVDIASLHLISPRRGEIVAIHNPHNPKEVLAKRIVGLPGETVHVRDDKVVIGWVCDAAPPHLVPEAPQDGQCQHTYPADTFFGGGATGKNQLEADMFLGPLDYYVLGDNRQGSEDSRLFGAVQPENFIGRVLFSL